jgi:IrrE N-terminal-like domain
MRATPREEIETRANVFSAGLLMPLDDFRRQIPDGDKVDLDMISHCADRYRVSLLAAILRWLNYTTRRAVLVVSRDGFILWSRASTPAWKTGAFFRTSGPPIPVPSQSPGHDHDGRTGIELPAGV